MKIWAWIGMMATTLVVVWVVWYLIIVALGTMVIVRTPNSPPPDQKVYKSFLECRYSFDMRVPAMPHITIVQGADMKFCQPESTKK